MRAADPNLSPAPAAAPKPRRWRRVWYVARCWLVLLLVGGGLVGLQTWANHDVAARRQQLQEHLCRRSDFSYRVWNIVSSRNLRGVEEALNQGAPLPRNRTAVAGIYQASVPGANLHSRYANFHAVISFNDRRPLAARIVVVSAPPREVGPLWIWSGKIRNWVLYAAAVVAAISFLVMPLSGPWRRAVAQICIGAALLAALAIALHPLVDWSWRRPSTDVIALGVAGVMVLGCLIVLLIPVRKPLYHSAACRNCKYDLTGNESGVCPECGTPIVTPEQRERQQRSADLAQALAMTELTAEGEAV